MFEIVSMFTLAIDLNRRRLKREKLIQRPLFRTPNNKWHLNFSSDNFIQLQFAKPS